MHKFDTLQDFFNSSNKHPSDFLKPGQNFQTLIQSSRLCCNKRCGISFIKKDLDFGIKSGTLNMIYMNLDINKNLENKIGYFSKLVNESNRWFFNKIIKDSVSLTRIPQKMSTILMRTFALIQRLIFTHCPSLTLLAWCLLSHLFW